MRTQPGCSRESPPLGLGDEASPHFVPCLPCDLGSVTFNCSKIRDNNLCLVEKVTHVVIYLSAMVRLLPKRGLFLKDLSNPEVRIRDTVFSYVNTGGAIAPLQDYKAVKLNS